MDLHDGEGAVALLTALERKIATAAPGGCGTEGTKRGVRVLTPMADVLKLA